MKAAACVIASGIYVNSSTSILELSLLSVPGLSDRDCSKSYASEGSMASTRIDVSLPPSRLLIRTSLVVINIRPYKLRGR